MKENVCILMVDDDADDRELFIEAVKEIDRQINCVLAKDGKHALEILKDTAGSLPDIIFLDLRMPRFNGKKFLLEVKNDERLKHIPVIIYTTSREVTESIEMKKMGAVHFISKPSNPDELYYMISVALEEQWNEIVRINTYK